MAENTSQTFSNHTRWDPLFHFFISPVFLVNVILTIVRFVRDISFENAWVMIVAIALFIAVFKIRTYALKAQDRVIRLEERLRMSALLPEPLRSKAAAGLTEGQIVALRFAPDSELEGLVEKCLSGALPKPGDIKKSIVVWRPDYFRI